MTPAQLRDPAWLAANADSASAFEMACAAALRRQQAQIEQMRAVLMKHIVLYRVDDDAYDQKAAAQRIYDLEMGMHA